jgi:hypothetical protein
MSTYCITFRIADRTAGGKTYDDRYQQLVDNVYTDTGYWDETTSFMLVSSGLSTPAFAAKACQGLSAQDDIVVVFDPTDMSASSFRPLKHPDVLSSFFPGLKKAA